MMPRWLSRWLYAKELLEWNRALEARLAARKLLRPERQAAARKGWDSRKMKGAR